VSAQILDRSLQDARDLMLDAVAQRPGSAVHRLRLGQVVFWRSRLAGGPPFAQRAELWLVPLELSAAAAPALEETWVSLAEGYLDAWSELSSSRREAAPGILKNAFFDPQFVSRNFLSAAAVTGLSQAKALLPSASRPLEMAARALARHGDMSGAAELWMRRREAERGEREGDLRRVEDRRRLGDLPGLRIACEAWMSAYSVDGLDDPTGRADAARILEICPNDRPGSWRGDARGRLIRFFLDGRESDVSADVLARAAEPLSGVPKSVAARIQLRAGRPSAAEDLAQHYREPDTPDSVSCLVALASRELERGQIAAARAALERLGPSGGGCDALLARRAVARAGGEAADVARMNERLLLDRSRGRSAQPLSGSSPITFELCLDPEAMGSSVLGLQVETAGPALLAYGWDGCTSGVLAVAEGSSILCVSLVGRSGSRSFSIRTLAGGPLREARAAVLAAPDAAPGAKARGAASENDWARGPIRKDS